jgi:hypothetical protein
VSLRQPEQYSQALSKSNREARHWQNKKQRNKQQQKERARFILAEGWEALSETDWFHCLEPVVKQYIMAAALDGVKLHFLTRKQKERKRRVRITSPPSRALPQ